MSFVSLPFFVPDYITLILIWMIIVLGVWILSLERRLKKQREVIHKVSRLEQAILPLVVDQSKKTRGPAEKDLQTTLHELSKE